MNCEYIIIGGRVKSNTAKQIIQNAYTKDPKAVDNINGYNIDKELSGNRVQVLHNPTTNKVIINHRGTKGFQDIITDLRLLVGNKSSNRFKYSKNITDKAKEKYENSDITHIGHSLGHQLAKEANSNNDELIGINQSRNYTK
jgi:hypothetical protein